MRIVHVIPGLTHERGGPTATVLALTHCQAAAGHAVAVLTTDQGARHGEHFAEPVPGVEVERVAVRGPDRVAYAPGFSTAVRGRLRGADVVHAHSIFTYPIHVTLREAAAVGVPLVLKPCGLLHPYGLGRSRWVKRAYLSLWGGRVRRACSRWHYTSEQEAAESWPPPPKPAFVLPNGVEPADFALSREFAQAHVNRRWPQLDGRLYVLFLSRLHAKKRLDLLLDAFLAAAPPEYRLIVAGPDEEDLWRPLAASRLRPPADQRVLRVGSVGGRDKVALLAGAELFALSSEHENFGIAALEALAARTPVLLSPHVDLAPALERAGLGWTAPLTLAAWSEQLAALLGADSPLRRRVEMPWRWVEQNYSWTALAARLDRHYLELHDRDRPVAAESPHALPQGSH
jgi:glycosyltransferase involved in cell wall biosynthesis